MQAPDFTRGDGPSFGDWSPEDVEWKPVGSAAETAREVGRESAGRVAVHVALFVLTAASCYMVAGPLYAVGLMAILLAHEMGHYLMSLRWRVRASLPYFLPFPNVPGLFQSPIGTFGAVITMKSRMPNRKALLDIGAAGPIAGFVVSLVLVTIGLALSTIQTLPAHWPPPGYVAYVFGDSLLFTALRWLVLGPVPHGADVILHPLARAGWVGLFVTALNLLPLGQLDGGHIVYALDRRHYRFVVLATTGLLLTLVFYSAVWTLFAFLALIFGRRHPPPADDYVPLDPLRRKIGYFSMVILVLCFMPNPLKVVGL